MKKDLSISNELKNIVGDFSKQISQVVMKLNDHIESKMQELHEIKEDLAYSRAEMREIAYVTEDLACEIEDVMDVAYNSYDEISETLDYIAPDLIREYDEDLDECEEEEEYDEDEDEEDGDEPTDEDEDEIVEEDNN